MLPPASMAEAQLTNAFQRILTKNAFHGSDIYDLFKK